MDGNSLPARLRELMEVRGWTVSDLAAHARLPKSTIEKYLGGHSKPNCVALVSICSGCDVSADWLLFGLSTEASESAMADAVAFSASRSIEAALNDMLWNIEQAEDKIEAVERLQDFAPVSAQYHGSVAKRFFLDFIRDMRSRARREIGSSASKNGGIPASNLTRNTHQT